MKTTLWKLPLVYQFNFKHTVTETSRGETIEGRRAVRNQSSDLEIQAEWEAEQTKVQVEQAT